jgi:hypothetical protein
MKTNRVTPSRVRQIGPRELAFLRGEPVGDFTPMPVYTHGYECACDACADCDPLPFDPDPQHSGRHGSVMQRYEGDQRPVRGVWPWLVFLVTFYAVLGLVILMAVR